MSDRIPVFVNRDGGTAARRGDRLADELTAAFDAAGVSIALHLLEGSAIGAAVKRAVGAPIVIVGGGDGTLGGAAGALAGTGSALGILPLGTHNHLARELGIPLDLTAAAKLIAERPLRRIDLACVNEHVFVNNASVGLYPALVRLRDDEQDRHGMPKWIAAVPASVAALKRLRHHRMRLMMPESAAAITTPMLFVGNNRYELERGRLGQRAALDDGKLSVFAVASRRRLALVGFALRTLVGASRDEDFAAIGDTSALTVEGSSRHIDIALDGEVVRLAMPLRFALRPQALKVVAPPA